LALVFPEHGIQRKPQIHLVLAGSAAKSGANICFQSSTQWNIRSISLRSTWSDTCVGLIAKKKNVFALNAVKRILPATENRGNRSDREPNARRH
jgi:hypothetical protein